MKLAPVSPQDAEAIALVKSACRRMQEDDLLRNLRDGYLVGQIQALEGEAMIKLRGAKTLEDFFEAKAAALASSKMTDFHTRLVAFGATPEEPKPA